MKKRNEKIYTNRKVSNPIREYLQISFNQPKKSYEIGFKPYKGVSSNIVTVKLLLKFT